MPVILVIIGMSVTLAKAVAAKSHWQLGVGSISPEENLVLGPLNCYNGLSPNAGDRYDFLDRGGQNTKLQMDIIQQNGNSRIEESN